MLKIVAHSLPKLYDNFVTAKHLFRETIAKTKILLQLC